MEKGFMCISSLDRFDELRRFLTSFQKHNSLPICTFLARDIVEAHRIKSYCGWFTPFDHTVFLDTDMMINGDLSELFSIVGKERLGIVRERGVKVLNSGVLVFPKELMQNLNLEWNEGYETKIEGGFRGEKGTWDQDILNCLLKQNPKDYPHIELPSKWNHIIKDVTPEEELRVYDEVKIFHFLHHPGVPRKKYKSYQEFMKL